MKEFRELEKVYREWQQENEELARLQDNCRDLKKSIEESKISLVNKIRKTSEEYDFNQANKRSHNRFVKNIKNELETITNDLTEIQLNKAKTQDRLQITLKSIEKSKKERDDYQFQIESVSAEVGVLGVWGCDEFI